MKTAAQSVLQSEDITNLLSHYTRGLNSYHEIRFNDRVNDLRNRWPLIQEIGPVAGGPGTEEKKL